MMHMTDGSRPSGAHTVDTLENAHYRDLRSVRANPRFNLAPVRRDMFRRLGLIKPSEPPRKPGLKRRPPAPRGYVLTDTGNMVLDQWLAEGGR